jgi:two-component sensor histidine kinase
MPLELGLVAAWSQPILGSSGQVLGTFGTYFRRPRMPSPIERLLVETLSHTAALAIERARREAQRDLLLDELNHRVKNTLAVVQSIAAHTLRSAPEPAAFASAFTDRIETLARAHSLLARNFWDAAPIADVVEASLAPFAVDGGAQIHWSGPEARIETGAAVALTLVLHELATNASKYGALSTPTGEVSIDWQIAHGGAGIGPRARFAWLERNGPRVSAPITRGFGSRLINASGGQLRGPVTLRFEPEGVRCELSLPLVG